MQGRRWIACAAAAAWLGACCVAALASDAPQPAARRPLDTLSGYEELVSSWVELKKQESAERAAWSEQKSALEQERVLLEQEKAALVEENARLEKSLSSDEARKQQLLRDKEMYQKILDPGLSSVLAHAAEDLALWRKIVPAPLQMAYLDWFRKIEMPTHLTPERRLQITLDLYLQIQKILGSVHRVAQVFRFEGSRDPGREFQVLYLGLACAYAVTSGGDMAGKGFALSGDGAWTWTWSADLAGLVNRALRMVGTRADTARLIRLPMRWLRAAQEAPHA